MNKDILVVIEHIRGQVADISFVMLAAAQDLAQWSGGQVIAVLLGHNNSSLSSNMKCDQVLYIDDPLLAEFTSEAYQKALSSLIGEKEPRAVLMGHTSIGTDIAGSISARLDYPLISSCRDFTADGKYICQICGGKIMTEGELPEKTTLLTLVPGGYKPEQGQSTQAPNVTTQPAPSIEGLRVSLTQYIEPETTDVDISREPLLISVGRGIQTQDNIELAEELAQALGGTVCASRPVVDQGWLPISRLVGKSGKVVKPKIYLMIGISGAPEHVEAILGSETIIAINTDVNAPIFNLAKYGTTSDLFDLVPILTEKVLAAK
jgi:electron transfer flavoprotein alpha subunit